MSSVISLDWDAITGRPTPITNLEANTIIGATITQSTYNGNIWTAGTGTLTIGAGKTATFSNTLTFTGTDASSIAFGVGGTVAYKGLSLAQFAATTSAELRGIISDETGTGSLVFATSPTLVTPVLGVATATTVNKVTFTPPATSAVLTIADGKTLTASNTLIFTGTDASSVALGTGGTVAYVANKLSVFAATTSLELKGVISDETGSGALVFANTPTLVTPVLGAATATTINAAAIAPGQYSAEPSSADATAGNIGEYSEASVASNAVSLTSTTPTNLANVVLQPGDWEVSFQPNYTGTTTSVTGLRLSLSLASATEDTNPGRFIAASYNSTNPFALFNVGLGRITRRVKVAAASTTTVYVVGRADFSGGNCFGYGLLSYRRPR